MSQINPNKVRRTDKKSPRKSIKPVTDNSTNVQVYLRCKNAGLKASKDNNKYLKFIDSDPVREVLLSSANVVYGFDRVFKEDTSQKHVFDHVAIPVLNDVLKGYCCTIFAYGQTGTGKTYTMEGDTNDTGLGPKAGIIPRIIHHMFTQLGSINKENHITVSMLELYNEELHDLLAVTDNSKQLSIYEDKDLGIKVKNLKEFPISSAAKGIELLKAGIKKRMTAATNYNKKSSRSHSIFTINVYKKNIKADGTEDFVVGRLNLVDLAGSENTKTAGSDQTRAREAASINKSLLTLGRVITKLVEKAPHIPYRESKLTRLLKDSLGGNTKTCIIATVSPSQQADDIRSTLEYASRATQILNTPTGYLEIECSLFEKNLAGEFDRLLADLRASHEKNGVYMSKAEFDKMSAEFQSLKQEKAAMEEDAAVRQQQEEARVASLQQQHQQEMMLLEQRHQQELQRVQKQLLEARADLDALSALSQKVSSELTSFFSSRKRNRED